MDLEVFTEILVVMEAFDARETPKRRHLLPKPKPHRSCIGVDGGEAHPHQNQYDNTENIAVQEDLYKQFSLTPSKDEPQTTPLKPLHSFGNASANTCDSKSSFVVIERPQAPSSAERSGRERLSFSKKNSLAFKSPLPASMAKYRQPETPQGKEPVPLSNERYAKSAPPLHLSEPSAYLRALSSITASSDPSSSRSTPLLTAKNHLPTGLDHCLQGVQALVCVYLDAGVSAQSAITRQLKSMGAKVLSKFSAKSCTHVVFKQGSKHLYERLRFHPVIKLVSVLWVAECYKQGRKVPEELYPVCKPDSSTSLIRKKALLPSPSPLPTLPKIISESKNESVTECRAMSESNLLSTTVPITKKQTSTGLEADRLAGSKEVFSNAGELQAGRSTAIIDGSMIFKEVEQLGGGSPCSKFSQSSVLLDVQDPELYCGAGLRIGEKSEDEVTLVGLGPRDRVSSPTDEVPLQSKRKQTVVRSHPLVPSIAHKRRRVEGEKCRELVFTGFDREEQAELQDTLKNSLCGFNVVEHVSETTTHLVLGGRKRTMSLLQAMALGCYVLSKSWLIKSLEAGAWEPETSYFAKDFFAKVADAFNEKPKILRGKTVYIGLTKAPLFGLQQLVEFAGGTCVDTLDPPPHYIVGDNLCSERSRPKGVPRVCETWLFNSIVSLELLETTSYSI